MKNNIVLIISLLLFSSLKSQIVFQANEFYKFKVESNLDLLYEFSKNKEIELPGGIADCEFIFDTMSNIVTVKNNYDSTNTSYPIVFKDLSSKTWMKIVIKSNKYGYCNYIIVDEPNVGIVLYNYWNEGEYNRGWQAVVKIKNPTL